MYEPAECRAYTQTLCGQHFAGAIIVIFNCAQFIRGSFVIFHIQTLHNRTTIPNRSRSNGSVCMPGAAALKALVIWIFWSANQISLIIKTGKNAALFIWQFERHTHAAHDNFTFPFRRIGRRAMSARHWEMRVMTRWLMGSNNSLPAQKLNGQGTKHLT